MSPRRRHHPPRRPRLVLRLGRAARRSGAPRPARHRRRRRRAGGQLRGQGVRRAHGDGRPPGPAAVPRTPSSCRPASRPTPTPAGPCSPSSTTPRRSSRGSPSTRRSSTSAACGGSPARPCEIATRLRAEVRERVGLAITVGVARTKFLAKVASASAKPDGLLVVPPDGESAFLHPLPVERVWGVGAKTAAKLHARGIDTVGDMARVGEGPLVTILGGYAGRHLYALAHHQDPRHVRRTPAPALDRLAERARAPAPHRRGARRRARRHRRPRHPAAARGRARRAHGHAAVPLRRLHAGHALAHDARADGGDRARPRRRPRPARLGARR